MQSTQSPGKLCVESKVRMSLTERMQPQKANQLFKPYLSLDSEVARKLKACSFLFFFFVGFFFF